MTHQIEIVPGVGGVDGLRVNGTLYPAAEVVAALTSRSQHLNVVQAARVAVAMADVARVVRGQLQAFGEHPSARRLLGHLDDAEAQAWAALAELIDPAAAGPRVPRP